MRHAYYLRLSQWDLAVLDVMKDLGPNNYLITRIFVPPKYRGQTVGHQLLTNACYDADRIGATLSLKASPSGGLNLEQLEAWYTRHRFVKQPSGLFIREPFRR